MMRMESIIVIFDLSSRYNNLILTFVTFFFFLQKLLSQLALSALVMLLRTFRLPLQKGTFSFIRIFWYRMAEATLGV